MRALVTNRSPSISTSGKIYFTWNSRWNCAISLMFFSRLLLNLISWLDIIPPTTFPYAVLLRLLVIRYKISRTSSLS